MELFKLLGTIAIDNSVANNALDETGEKGVQAESKLGKAFKSVGKGAVAVGKAVGVGMVAAGTAVAGLVTSSVQSYAQYEQLVGGVETLFKESAGKVIEYADNAFKTAGMSSNEYMETVTSFSASLLQGLGGDTDKAAEVANRAITDMSDNANKMGTDMTMIQNAYQGFAKQNYTMLDNLKLGYGGTQAEMARLINDSGVLGDSIEVTAETVNQVSFDKIIEAIGVVQDEMGITGTTAAEAAGTISGSAASVGAAWQNLVTAMADDNADVGSYINIFVDAVSTAAENMLPRIEIALNGVVQLIEKLAPAIIGKIPQLLSTLLPSIVNAATGMINALVDILPGMVTAITDILPALISGFVTIINGLVQALPSVVQALVDALPTLIPAVIEGLASMIVTLVSVIPQIIQPLLDALPEIITLLVETLLDVLPTMITGITMMITELINMLPQVLPAIIQGIMQIITLIIGQLPVILPQIVNAIVMIINLLGEQLPVLIPLLVDAMIQIITMLTEQLPIILPMVIEAVISIVQAIIENLPTIMLALIEALPDILQAVWDAIVMVFENLPEWFGMLFDGAVDLIHGAFDSLGEYFSGIWDVVCEVFAPVGDFFSDMFSGAWNGIKSAWSGVKNFFSGIWTGIKNAFGSVADWFKNIFSKAWTAVKNVFSTGGKVFDGIKEGITNVFTTVVNAIIRGINKVIKLPFEGLNGILDRIYGIEIAGIKPFSWLTWRAPVPEIPELEEGGVLKKGQTGYLEGNDDEAVVPLKRNTEWMETVAKKIHSFMIDATNQPGNPAVYGYATRSSNDQAAAIRADVEELKETLGGILDRIDSYFPDVLEHMERPIPAVVGVDQAADALTDPINYRLGRIAERKGRGR